MLETKRCKLTSLRTDDLNDVVKLYGNPKVRQFLGGPVAADEVHKRLFSWFESDTTTQRWAIRLKHHNDFLGIIYLGLHHNEFDQEISYQLLPAWWGMGYARETVGAVIDYALYQLDLPRIVAETQTANVASCRLLAGLGMERAQIVERFGEEQAIYVRNQ